MDIEEEQDIVGRCRWLASALRRNRNDAEIEAHCLEDAASEIENLRESYKALVAILKSREKRLE